MSSETVRFPQLNHTNYAEWSLRMEAILIRGGFWDLVTGDEKLKDEKDVEGVKVFRRTSEEGRLSVGRRLF